LSQAWEADPELVIEPILEQLSGLLQLGLLKGGGGGMELESSDMGAQLEDKW